MDHEQMLSDHLQRVTVVTGSIVASVIVVMGIGWFFTKNGTPMIAPTDGPPYLPLALMVVGIAALAGAGGLVRRMLQAAKKKTPDARLQAYVSAGIVGAAIRESAAIMGLVASLVSGDPTWVLALGTLALVAIVAAWPRREHLEGLIDSQA